MVVKSVREVVCYGIGVCERASERIGQCNVQSGEK